MAEEQMDKKSEIACLKRNSVLRGRLSSSWNYGIDLGIGYHFDYFK